MHWKKYIIFDKDLKESKLISITESRLFKEEKIYMLIIIRFPQKFF